MARQCWSPNGFHKGVSKIWCPECFPQVFPKGGPSQGDRIGFHKCGSPKGVPQAVPQVVFPRLVPLEGFPKGVLGGPQGE